MGDLFMKDDNDETGKNGTKGKNAIEISRLTKEFGDVRAVDDIDLVVKKGEIFGLLGPNGAGKTTTIKMLSTMLKPSSGRAEVCGFDVVDSPDDVRACIGIVFQDPSIDTDLTGRENLDFHARMYGIRDRDSRVQDALKMVGLFDKKDMLLKTYSGGMKRRLEIARGLMHYPKVLFLDEPTLGLDAQTRRVIWDHIKKINRDMDVTIILTTHYMDEADFLCDRVAIIDHGRVLALGSPKQLKESMGADMVAVKTNKPKKFAEAMKRQKWVEKAKIYEKTVRISLRNAETRIADIIRITDKLSIKVSSVEQHTPTLEDVFIHFTGRRIRDEIADKRSDLVLEARMRGTH
jgi:ABC-2 type transport system ATP-binding protein